MKRIVLLLCGICLLAVANAQIRSVPPVVKSTIESHYPEAKHVEYEDFLTRYQVHLVSGKDSIVVAISNGGKIKSVSTILSLESLPEAVETGLSKSKYADWELTNLEKLERPGADLQYKLTLDGGNAWNRKNVYFSKSGRLLKDRRALDLSIK